MSLPSTLEAQYVASTVGELKFKSNWLEKPLLLINNNKGTALSQGLAEIIQKRPADPVEYLANYLYKYNENKIQKQKVISQINNIIAIQIIILNLFFIY